MAAKIRKRNGITILEPGGKMVESSVPELREVILPEIEAADAPHVLINFEHVNRMDSSGLGALVEVRSLASRRNGRIGVINVSQQINDLIVLSRLVRVFEHYDSEDAAVSGLSI
ncbi:MAG: STAS domain-containing protein [Candidatus Poribacteria bacterium]|nr:STAS domain-containing protein [Candidatus Poribacteria bacterium]